MKLYCEQARKIIKELAQKRRVLECVRMMKSASEIHTGNICRAKTGYIVSGIIILIKEINPITNLSAHQKCGNSQARNFQRLPLRF